MRGVKGLMIAVLEEAITSLSKGRSAGARNRVRRMAAARWLRSDDKSHPFAFESICDALALDAGRIRRRVLDTEFDGISGPRVRVERRVETQLPRIKPTTKRVRIRVRQRAAS